MEVVDTSVMPCVLQMVVEPSQQELFRRELEQVGELLIGMFQTDQIWVVLQVDIGCNSDLWEIWNLMGEFRWSYSEDLPQNAKNDMFSLFYDEWGCDADDDASDGLGWGDCQSEVFLLFLMGKLKKNRNTFCWKTLRGFLVLIALLSIVPGTALLISLLHGKGLGDVAWINSLPEKDARGDGCEKAISLRINGQNVSQICVVLEGETNDVWETSLLFVGEGVITNTTFLFDYVSVPTGKKKSNRRSQWE